MTKKSPPCIGAQNRTQVNSQSTSQKASDGFPMFLFLHFIIHHFNMCLSVTRSINIYLNGLR